MILKEFREIINRIPADYDGLTVMSEGCDCIEEAHGIDIDRYGVTVARSTHGLAIEKKH